MVRRKDRARGQAWEAFSEVFGGRAGASIGRLRSIGGGLAREVFAARVSFEPDPDDESGGYVALVPLVDAGDAFAERARREARLLEWLSWQDLPFGVPVVVALVEGETGPILVERGVPGLPLEFRTKRNRGEPWKVVGEVAAAIHELDPSLAEGVSGGSATRRAHSESCLAESAELTDEGALVRDARAWMSEHLPPNEPSALLHGDLLGQNILMPFYPEDGIVVIDWDLAIVGDPAYELAIVTRGRRRPFQRNNGLTLLLEAYAEAGGRTMSPVDVSFYELYLALGWYAQSLDPATRVHPPEQALQELGGVLRRAEERAAR